MRDGIRRCDVKTPRFLFNGDRSVFFRGSLLLRVALRFRPPLLPAGEGERDHRERENANISHADVSRVCARPPCTNLRC